MLKQIYFLTKNFLLDLLFPRICVGCGDEGSWVCRNCLGKIDIIKQPFCPECRRPTIIGEFCSNCRGGVSPPALDGIFICANFDEGVLKEATHQFKYNGVFDIGGILGQIMAGKMRAINQEIKKTINQENCSPNHPDLRGWDLVIPVPLHKKRLRERGFNQSEILSRELSRINHEFHEGGKMVIAKNILIRKKYTTPQAELKREERLKNLKEVFVVNNVGAENFLPLQDKNILLVDDITTTGATMEECAKVLKQNGAKSVWGIVLAKGK